MTKLLCTVTALAATVQLAWADLYNFNGTDVNVEYWSSGGSAVDMDTYSGDDSMAVLVVDFGADSYAFGYLWGSGTPTGNDLVDSTASAGSLAYTTADFGFGPYVDSIRYAGQTMGTGGWPSDWISYWNSTDGDTWNYASVGAGDRTLSDGDWDGWSNETTSDGSTQPTTPVPEPGTVLLSALGAAIIGLRRLKQG